MDALSRRSFLGSSIGSLAAMSLGESLLAQEAQSPQQASSAASQRIAPDTLFLTWKSDPTTTMDIQWVGPETTVTGVIRYAPGLGDAWQTGNIIAKPFPDTDLKVNRCELSGLAPGTDYFFQIGTNSPVYRFRTMPAKAANAIQFVSGGDCGTNSHAIGTNILAAKQEPYFALIGGDLAYDNGRSPKTFLEYLRNYSKHMVDPRGRLVPMISCIGNHEVNGGYKKSAPTPPLI